MIFNAVSQRGGRLVCCLFLCSVLRHLQAQTAAAQSPHRMNPTQTEKLHSLLLQTRQRNLRYQSPSPAELRQAAAAGRTMFASPCIAAGPEVVQLLKAAHFELVDTALGAGPALAAREDSAHRRGGGVYFFRRGALPRERLVQVPHSFFDVGTLGIGIELAGALQARALFVNTVHRYPGGNPPAGDPEEPSASPADLAHQENTFFQIFTRAALSALSRPQVIQVHGFADRSLHDWPDAAVVVSPGAATAGSAEASQVAARLALLLGKQRVLLYPRDTRQLGAQTNAQGRAVAATAQATFLHLELSRSLRDQLIHDVALRRSFFSAVAGLGSQTP